jgi:hypothetical protein
VFPKDAIRKYIEKLDREIIGLRPLEEARHLIVGIAVTRADDRLLYCTIELAGGAVIGGYIDRRHKLRLAQIMVNETGRCISAGFLAWLREVLE